MNADVKEIFEFLKDSVHEEILSILSLNQADPLLLLSCCEFAKTYFSHREVVNNVVLLGVKLPKIDNCTKLLPYLGGSAYQKALSECNKYLGLESGYSDKIKLDISVQHNSLMNQLLISIINLIELICKEAVKTKFKTHLLFKDISDVLNENEREKYLFNCFVVPNDEVRVALVNCILQVPLKELDIDEITHLMKVIGEAKSIGAGKAEEIISTIFMIFINLIVDNENSASSAFRTKHGKTAISR